YTIMKKPPPSTMFTFAAVTVGSICVVKVPARSRVRPLKTSVAVLGYCKADGTDVSLAGYGQLGPEQFSAVEPNVTVVAATPSAVGRLLIDWRRTAIVRVVQRNPDPATQVLYEAVVTGPGGETFPFVKS